jgi:hypothetical protein
MKVLVVIVRLRDESLRVSVAPQTLKGIGVWVKKFQSEERCLTELKTLGLLTTLDAAKADKSEAEKRTILLRFRAVAKPEALLAAQFAYI